MTATKESTNSCCNCLKAALNLPMKPYTLLRASDSDTPDWTTLKLTGHCTGTKIQENHVRHFLPLNSLLFLLLIVYILFIFIFFCKYFIALLFLLEIRNSRILGFLKTATIFKLLYLPVWHGSKFHRYLFCLQTFY